MVIVTGAGDRSAVPMTVTLYSALANMEQGRAVSVKWGCDWRFLGRIGQGAKNGVGGSKARLPCGESD